MEEMQFCCAQAATNSHLPAKPFSRILALGFYDGPTSGLLQCAACGADHRFDMLDWDDEHTVRIFRLAALPTGSLDRCQTLLKQVEEPRWPVWVPFTRTRPADEVRTRLSQQVDAILSQAAPAEWVVAWSGYGDQILAASKVAPNVLTGLADWFNQQEPDQGRDWFAVLGLRRNRAEAKLGA